MIKETIEFEWVCDSGYDYIVYLDVTYPNLSAENWTHDNYPILNEYTAFRVDRDGGEHERAIDIPEEILYNEACKYAQYL